MKNKLLNNIITIVLAQLVLFASTSFVVNFHLCENHINSFSLLGKAATCENMTCDLSSSNGSMQMKKSCCLNERIVGTAHQFHKSQKIEIKKINDTVSLLLQDDTSILKHNLKKDCFIGYSPPLHTCNFKILYQSYLI